MVLVFTLLKSFNPSDCWFVGTFINIYVELIVQSSAIMHINNQEIRYYLWPIISDLNYMLNIYPCFPKLQVPMCWNQSLDFDTFLPI